jgi:transcription elongation factor GreA
MSEIPMTTNGAKQLHQELAVLKAERPKIAKAIGAARELGDLRENAEYHAAKEQQGLVEARIRDIETKLANAQIIDPTKITTDKIVFGATVYLLNTNTDEELRYQIVGEDEANMKSAKISISSPIARALIGKRVNDIAEVVTPSGTIEYEIIKIEYI